MKIEEFKEIESFFNSYKARYIEVILLNRNMPNRKILIMHLGGIVIECLLKHRVIKEKNIIKRYRTDIWYNQEKVDLLLSMGNVNKTDRKANGIENPKHELKEIAKLDSVLNSKLTSEEQFVKDLNIIYNPLEREKECFIDLRYINDGDIEDLQLKFDNWNEAFKRVHNTIKI